MTCADSPERLGLAAKTHGGCGARIDFLADHRDLVPAMARWLWREWGYTSAERCAQHMLRWGRDAIPAGYVALLREEPIGTVSLIENNLPPHSYLRPWLAGLYVRSKYRGGGVGTALVRFCEREAARLGVTRLYLYTESAEGFYQRLGWTTIDGDVYEGEPIAIMSKELGETEAR